MASITVYVLDENGRLDCERTGDINSVMLAIDIEQTDFTMQRPPDNGHRWRWRDSDWIADDTAN